MLILIWNSESSWERCKYEFCDWFAKVKGVLILSLLFLIIILRHFITCEKTIDGSMFLIFSFSEIVKFHAFPNSSTSDRDTNFLIQFWRHLWKWIVTSLLYSNTYHFQLVGKLRNEQSFASERPKQWDLVLTQAQFAYNSIVNRSTRKSPFQTIYGMVSRH
jgi:hypothetical protein